MRKNPTCCQTTIAAEKKDNRNSRRFGKGKKPLRRSTIKNMVRQIGYRAQISQ